MDSNENILCLIAGYTSNTGFQGPLGQIKFGILWRILYMLDLFGSDFYEELFFIIFVLSVFGSLRWDFNLLPFGYGIGLGLKNYFDQYYPFKPAEGWLHTRGLNGEKQWNGTLSGDLPIHRFIYEIYVCYPGVLGFTGLKFLSKGMPLYLGSALWVKIKNV